MHSLILSLWMGGEGGERLGGVLKEGVGPGNMAAMLGPWREPVGGQIE